GFLYPSGPGGTCSCVAGLGGRRTPVISPGLTIQPSPAPAQRIGWEQSARCPPPFETSLSHTKSMPGRSIRSRLCSHPHSSRRPCVMRQAGAAVHFGRKERELRPNRMPGGLALMDELPKATTLSEKQTGRSFLRTGHPEVRHGRVGVLLLNLGTPDATDYWSMRRYLKEFLSDRRVIETSRLIWWPILNFIILTKRPGPKGGDYDKIWNKEKNEGPLKTITRDQAEKLAAALDNPQVVV